MTGSTIIDFAGVGTVKSGTSWLAACLAEHPQICIPAIKELNYFSDSHPTDALGAKRIYAGSNRALGDTWLAGQFHQWQPGQLRGDYSPGYLAEPDCPGLLHAHNPRIKLLATFRNPVEVLYSGYYQIKRTYSIYYDFETAVAKLPHMVEYCRYHKHVNRFLEHFPREQMLLILYDDIRANPAAVYAQTCRFLGVRDDFTPPSLNQRVNPRTVPRSALVRDARAKIRALIGSAQFTRILWGSLARSGLLKPLRAIYNLNEKPDVTPPINPETRARIMKLFEDDNLKLGELLGRDLSHWNR